MNSPAPQSKLERIAPQPFQAVMITLSAALLVLFGIVIGRFVVTTQAVEVVEHFDSEMTTLRAELVDLNRQLVQAESQAALAQESAERYRQLATQERIRADKLVTRQLVCTHTISDLLKQRQTCLDELQQHVVRNQAIPASAVVSFAEGMFDAYARTLQQVASGTDAPAGQMPSLPRLQVREEFAADHDPTPVGSVPAGRAALVANGSTNTLPRLPAPTAVTSHQSSPPKQNNGVFFSPPRRQQPSQYMYFSAQRTRQMVSLPPSSGITFLDTAEADDGETVRR